MIDSKHWKFRHVGMIVKDFDKAVEQYRQLGFEFVKEPWVSSPPIPNAPKSQIAHMRGGDLVIEIIRPLEGKFVNMDFMETVGEGLNHVCYYVEDLPSERQKLIDVGCPPVYEAEMFAYFDTRKAGNMIIELRALP